jgi:hypothetical protein
MPKLATVQDREAYLREFLAEVHDDVDAAREAEGWTAVSKLAALALKIRDELDALRPPKRDASELTEAELAERLARAVRVLPAEHLEIIEAALAERRVH